jgi:cytochrome c1
MKNTLTIILSFLLVNILFISCSQVNRESRDHLDQKNKMRHGIIPLDSKTTSKRSHAIGKIDIKRAKKGKFVYQKNCQSCHGASGTGDGPEGKELGIAPKDLTKVMKEVPHFSFYISISQWVGDMPGWRKMLTDEELKDLTHYLKTLVKNGQ